MQFLSQMLRLSEKKYLRNRHSKLFLRPKIIYGQSKEDGITLAQRCQLKRSSYY